MRVSVFSIGVLALLLLCHAAFAVLDLNMGPKADAGPRVVTTMTAESTLNAEASASIEASHKKTLKSTTEVEADVKAEIGAVSKDKAQATTEKVKVTAEVKPNKYKGEKDDKKMYKKDDKKNDNDEDCFDFEFEVDTNFDAHPKTDYSFSGVDVNVGKKHKKVKVDADINADVDYKKADLDFDKYLNGYKSDLSIDSKAKTDLSFDRKVKSDLDIDVKAKADLKAKDKIDFDYKSKKNYEVDIDVDANTEYKKVDLDYDKYLNGYKSDLSIDAKAKTDFKFEWDCKKCEKKNVPKPQPEPEPQPEPAPQPAPEPQYWDSGVAPMKNKRAATGAKYTVRLDRSRAPELHANFASKNIKMTMKRVFEYVDNGNNGFQFDGSDLLVSNMGEDFPEFEQPAEPVHQNFNWLFEADTGELNALDGRNAHILAESNNGALSFLFAVNNPGNNVIESMVLKKRQLMNPNAFSFDMLIDTDKFKSNGWMQPERESTMAFATTIESTMPVKVCEAEEGEDALCFYENDGEQVAAYMRWSKAFECEDGSSVAISNVQMDQDVIDDVTTTSLVFSIDGLGKAFGRCRFDPIIDPLVL